MNLKNWIVATVVGFTGLGTTVMPALAETTEYSFYQYIGDIWVGKAKVYNNKSGGVTATAEVNMPTCGAFSYLKGYINFDYVSEGGGHFSNYKFYVEGKEGYHNVNAFVNVPYNMSSNGKLNITDKTYCYGL